MSNNCVSDDDCVLLRALTHCRDSGVMGPADSHLRLIIWLLNCVVLLILRYLAQGMSTSRAIGSSIAGDCTRSQMGGACTTVQLSAVAILAEYILLIVTCLISLSQRLACQEMMKRGLQLEGQDKCYPVMSTA